MKPKYRKKPENIRGIALERINILFGQADSKFKENPALSDRYVQLARKIGMRYKVRIPPDLRKKFCRHCYSFLMPPLNCRIRLRNQKVVYYCLNCKKYMRFPYLREKKERRKKA